jgi:hypothetical protein
MIFRRSEVSMQLWFLSVLLNVFSGLVLIFFAETEESSGGDAVPVFFQNKTFRLVLGILTALVGFVKIFAVIARPPVFGDFLPALAGIAGGGALLVDYYLNSTSAGFELPAIVKKICIDERKYVGIVCVAVSVLHFIFPHVIFL